MFKLDNAFLEELGLGSLPPVEKNKMLAHIYETLEMRVGMRLAEQMTNEQLDEFERYINAQDEAGALKWLESNFPNYKQVVAEELEKLKAEISQVAPQIVAQAQENAALAATAPAVLEPAQPQPQPQPQQFAAPVPQQPPLEPAQQQYQQPQMPMSQQQQAPVYQQPIDPSLQPQKYQPQQQQYPDQQPIQQDSQSPQQPWQPQQ